MVPFFKGSFLVNRLLGKRPDRKFRRIAVSACNPHPIDDAYSRYRSLFGVENEKLPEIKHRKFYQSAPPTLTKTLPTRIENFLNEVMKITTINSVLYNKSTTENSCGTQQILHLHLFLVWHLG